MDKYDELARRLFVWISPNVDYDETVYAFSTILRESFPYLQTSIECPQCGQLINITVPTDKEERNGDT